MNVVGDEQIDLPVSVSISKEKEMSVVDLSPNVANQLMTETVGNIQANNREGRDSAAVAQAHLRFAAVRNFDELGPTESRAVSGVLATPVASPTTQQG